MLNPQPVNRRTAFWIVNGLFAAAFALSVAVQLNDPDPWRWMAIYAAACAACLLPVRVAWTRAVPPIVLVVAVAWSLTLVDALPRLRIGELFEEIEMKSIDVERARECIGLLIVAAWMAVLSVRAWRAHRQR